MRLEGGSVYSVPEHMLMFTFFLLSQKAVPKIKLSSSLEKTPGDTTLQASLSEVTRLETVGSTSPLTSHFATDRQDVTAKAVVKTQTSMQMADVTNKDKDKLKTVDEEMIQGAAEKPQKESLTGNKYLSNSHTDMLGTMTQTWTKSGSAITSNPPAYIRQTDEDPRRLHQLSVLRKEDSLKKNEARLEDIESAVSSPNTQIKNPTAPSITSASKEEAERAGSDLYRPQILVTRSSHIVESNTESGIVSSTRHPSSEEEGVWETTQEASQLLETPAALLSTTSNKGFQTTTETEVSAKSTTEDIAALQTHLIPNPTVLTPTLQSGEALSKKDVVFEIGSVSAGVMIEEEVEDKLEEEGETESHGNDQSSLDWISQFSTVRSITVKADNQPHTFIVRHRGTEVRPGIRGQWVRH